MTQPTKAELNQRLLAAANANNFEEVLTQLDLGADLSAKDDDNTTAAILLGWKGNGAAVVELAQRDPTILTQANTSGYTATIWLAADANQKVDDIVALAKINPEVLLQANIHKDTPAILLAFSGHVQGVLALARLNPDVLRQRDDKGYTCGHWLAENRYHDALLALAAEFPEVLTIPDLKGMTVAQLYMAKRNVPMVRQMLQLEPTLIYEPGVKPFMRKYDRTVMGRLSQLFWKDQPAGDRPTKKR